MNTAADASETAQVEDLARLERHVSELAELAESSTRIHDRIAWIAYGAMFLAAPIVVLVFRLHMQADAYYLAGALMLACGLVICAMDFMGSTARGKALQAVQRAQAACEAARQSRSA